jgi:uncharacterized membrane protein
VRSHVVKKTDEITSAPLSFSQYYEMERLSGPSLSSKHEKLKFISKLLLTLLFVGAGVMHFLKPAFYLPAMPPWIPQPLAMIYISGACEIVGAIAILIPRLSSLAGWGLVALLIAVYPANIHMALKPELFPNLPGWLLWLRLPLQFVFIYWVWTATLRDDS